MLIYSIFLFLVFIHLIRSDCINHCSGHGMCQVDTTGTIMLPLCTCFDGYKGRDCSRKECPKGRTFFGDVTAIDTSHSLEECSGNGYCDETTGLCTCRTGFSGSGCERIDCPKNSGETCSGHGQCKTLAQRGTEVGYKYDLWDADQSTGCVCDDGYTGYNCNTRTCPKGVDPKTVQTEVQVLDCQCDAVCSGVFRLTYNAVEATVDINPTDDASTLQTTIRTIPALADAIVTYPNGETVICDATGTSATIEMPSATMTKVYDLSITSDTLATTGAIASHTIFVDGANGLLGSTPSSRSTNRVTEVQVLDCLCTAACGGGFKISYGGETTALINYNDDSSTVQTKIRTLSDAADAIVEFTGDICQNAGNSASFEFPSATTTSSTFTVVDITLTSDPLVLEVKTAGSVGAYGTTPSSITTTRKLEECSGRGTCSTDGYCTCVTGFAASDGNNGAATESVGYNNCGYESIEQSVCPYSCSTGSSGGTCSNAPDYRCTCNAGRQGIGCQIVECPSSNAWWDTPTGENEAHASTECSGRGTCNTSTSVCECDDLFEGDGCETMKCAGGTTCSGHGTCVTLQSNAVTAGYTYGTDSTVKSTWGATQIKGCQCESLNYIGHLQGHIPNWDGYDCSKYTCPSGADPWTRDDYNEIQAFYCSATSGSFYISFNGVQSSSPVQYDLTANGFRSELYNLTTINAPIVEIETSGETSICSANGVVTLIKFTHEAGDLPLITLTDVSLSPSAASGSAHFYEWRKGISESGVCSNMGYCDSDRGLCSCFTGWGSSNGMHGTGALGDCGYWNEKEAAAAMS
eukprot:TRINITY_DN3288_c0_g1_i2.p1 TRINITY_DN3288_c0_g1~~TRINITY_DN3288_c0_g1_i2.p1  ORF type:complete len:806 (+),score=194.93 TRINITY_DN3288_c0_g1_i2:122-2539(+)